MSPSSPKNKKISCKKLILAVHIPDVAAATALLSFSYCIGASVSRAKGVAPSAETGIEASDAGIGNGLRKWREGKTLLWQASL